jgi:predicted nucleic acid-binding protein
MRYVLDASVALRWVLSDDFTQKAISLRGQYQQKALDLISPDIYIDEVASALTKAERQKSILVGEAASLYAKIMNTPPIFHSRLPLIPRAIDISSQTRSSFYDCLYVALAEQEGCELVTVDAKLIRNLQSRFPFIVPLTSIP